MKSLELIMTLSVPAMCRLFASRISHRAAIRFFVSSMVPLFLVLGMSSPAWSQKMGTGNWCKSITVETARGDARADDCAAFSAVVIEGESFSVTHGFTFESVVGAGTGPTDEIAQVVAFGIQIDVNPSNILTETARADTGRWAELAPSLPYLDWGPSALGDFISIYTTFGAGVPCSVGDCVVSEVIEVQYTASTAGSVIMQNADSAGMWDDRFQFRVVRTQVATIHVVQAQILVDARLNHGADGGTISLTGVIPISTPTISTVVTADGQMTCLETTPATCEVDTTFSADIATFAIAFPAAPSCNGNTCTTISSAAVFGPLPAAADFTDGRVSISFTGVQYNLDLAGFYSDATFLIESANAVINGANTVVRVFIRAD